MSATDDDIDYQDIDDRKEEMEVVSRFESLSKAIQSHNKVVTKDKDINIKNVFHFNELKSVKDLKERETQFNWMNDLKKILSQD